MANLEYQTIDIAIIENEQCELIVFLNDMYGASIELADGGDISFDSSDVALQCWNNLKSGKWTIKYALEYAANLRV